MQNGTQNQTKKDFLDIIFIIFESKKIIAFTTLVGVIFLFTNYSGMLHYIHPDNEKVFVYFEFLRILISHFDSLFFALTTCIIIFQSKDQSTKILFCFFESSFLFLNLGRDKIPILLGVTETNAKMYLVFYVAVFSGFAFLYLGKLAKMHRQTTIANDTPPHVQDTTPKEKTKTTHTPHPSPTDAPQEVKNIVVEGFKVPIINPDHLPKNKSTNDIYTILNNDPKIMELNKKTENTAQETKTKTTGRPNLTEEKIQEVKDFVNENPNASLREVEKATDVSHTKVNQLKKQLDIFG